VLLQYFQNHTSAFIVSQTNKGGRSQYAECASLWKSGWALSSSVFLLKVACSNFNDKYVIKYFFMFSQLASMSQLKNQLLLKKIANRIKLLREKQDVTQEQFYYDTGIHLGRIETGKMNISISTLDSICRYFNLTLEEFFKGM
jgi:DNA-binding XRE family transcriptional regulator